MNPKNKVVEIVIPEKISVYEDVRTKVKSVAFPLTFPDGRNGILTLTKLSKELFLANEEISKIIIEFK